MSSTNSDKAPYSGLKVTILPEDRWEKGIEHDARSEAIYSFMQGYDVAYNNDTLGLKCGGDGDNGEEIMYLLDEYFAAQDSSNTATEPVSQGKALSDEDRTAPIPENPESLEAKNHFLTDDLEASAAKSLDLIFSYGQIDGGHHKAWVIDQVTRELTGEKYEDFVTSYTLGEVEGLDIADEEAVAKAKKIASGDYDWEDEDSFSDEEISNVENNYYEWDEGIAP